MLATETRVQLSILGYLFSDLKKAGVSYQLSVISYQLSVISSLRKHPTPYTPHPTYLDLRTFLSKLDHKL